MKALLARLCLWRAEYHRDAAWETWDPSTYNSHILARDKWYARYDRLTEDTK